MATASVQPATDKINVKENCMKKDEKNVPEASTANTVSSKDVSTSPASVISSENKLAGDDSCSMRISEAKGAHMTLANSSTSTLSYPVKKENGKKVAFVAVKPPAPSTADQSKFHLKHTERNEKDPFFDLLTSGNKSSLL